MARLFGCFALLVFGALLVPAWAQEKDKKDPAKAVKDKKITLKDDDDEPKKDAKDKKIDKKEEEKVVYGQVQKGRLKRMDGNSAREFVFEVPMLDKKKILEMEVWKAQQTAEIARTAPRDRPGRIAQFQRELIQKQANLYSPFDQDVRAADNVKVRSNFPPIVYDDRGFMKQWTKKELLALRGNSKLPGYPADFEALKPGQYIEVYFAKVKTPPPAAKKGIKLDDEDDLRPRPEAVMIVILQEAPKGG